MQGVPLPSHARFKEVVQPHLGNAHSLARSLARNRADADDIVQEACLRALRGIAHFRGASARAWVLTIVRHTAYDWMRRGRRAPELVDDLEGLVESLTGPDDSVTPEAKLAADQDAQQMEQAIQLLPAQFSKALRLYYERGLSYLEIAEAIGVPPGTVMSRLCRARRQLGAIMEKMAA
jgi:RNA polymerase sigma factor (sigma-70 family)